MQVHSGKASVEFVSHLHLPSKFSEVQFMGCTHHLLHLSQSNRNLKLSTWSMLKTMVQKVHWRSLQTLYLLQDNL